MATALTVGAALWQADRLLEDELAIKLGWPVERVTDALDYAIKAAGAAASAE